MRRLSINCHAGRLPFYRGRNILNWALINGEKSFGITVHYIDEGIDTGDIIHQVEIEITLEDDYSSILQKAYSHCATVLLKAIHLIQHGQVKRISQKEIHPVGFYCGRRKKGDEWIGWSLTSIRIHNLVRGITLPGPCAQSLYKGKKIAIVKTKLLPQAPFYIGTPGEVVGRTEEGVFIKTGDTSLLISQIADLDLNGKPINIYTPRFSIGERLGRNITNEMNLLREQIKDLKEELLR